jgi:c-di-GMP-binding flagellar brake protein YcgR
MPTPTPNRRLAARYTVDLRLRAQVRVENKPKTVHGQASDLSLGGMAVYLPLELPVGDKIEIEVTLPYTTAPAKIDAVIRSRRSYQYGVEFVNPSASANSAINRACASLALVQS